MYTYICMYIQITNVCINTYICTHKHTQTHTNTHKHTHTGAATWTIRRKSMDMDTVMKPSLPAPTWWRGGREHLARRSSQESTADSDSKLSTAPRTRRTAPRTRRTPSKPIGFQEAMAVDVVTDIDSMSAAGW